MLKEFIEHIQKTTQPQIVTVSGRTFAVNAEGEANEIRPDIDHPYALTLQSLDALVKLVQTEATNMEAPLYITIPNHLTVNCFGQPNPNSQHHRQFYYEAKATDVPGWGEKVEMGFEEAQIALRTRFQETNDTQYALRLLSEISTGAKITLNDNGIATTVVTKKGIDLQANEAIRPIITLKPYRTFQEIEQPESIFLIRVNTKNITFTEADGGMWKLKARQTVKAFLEEKLADLVQAEGVYIAL